MSNDTVQGYLEALQDWYYSQCDGDWEHEYGIKIETVDNPGWSVSIPLADTPLAGRAFTPVQRRQVGEDWIFCRIEESIFRGDGGPRCLVEIVHAFVDWMRAETVRS
jgi:hypothetical protein